MQKGGWKEVWETDRKMSDKQDNMRHCGVLLNMLVLTICAKIEELVLSY